MTIKKGGVNIQLCCRLVSRIVYTGPLFQVMVAGIRGCGHAAFRPAIIQAVSTGWDLEIEI
jgi:hypothetical protein